jgi:hypothetical protein
MARAMLSDKNTPASVDKFIEQLKTWETDMPSSQIGATDVIHDKIQQVKTNMHAIMRAYTVCNRGDGSRGSGLKMCFSQIIF